MADPEVTSQVVWSEVTDAAGVARKWSKCPGEWRVVTGEAKATAVLRLPRVVELGKLREILWDSV